MKIDLENDPPESIEMQSVVNEDGEPFAHFFLKLKSGMRIPIAQVSPSQLRRHGAQALEVAEAAESDAAVFRMLTQEIRVDKAIAAQMVVELRRFRVEGGKST